MTPRPSRLHLGPSHSTSDHNAARAAPLCRLWTCRTRAPKSQALGVRHGAWSRLPRVPTRRRLHKEHGPLLLGPAPRGLRHHPLEPAPRGPAGSAISPARAMPAPCGLLHHPLEPAPRGLRHHPLEPAPRGLRHHPLEPAPRGLRHHKPLEAPNATSQRRWRGSTPNHPSALRSGTRKGFNPPEQQHTTCSQASGRGRKFD
jgi:hypothetical protein